MDIIPDRVSHELKYCFQSSPTVQGKNYKRNIVSERKIRILATANLFDVLSRLQSTQFATVTVFAWLRQRKCQHKAIIDLRKNANFSHFSHK